MNETVEKNKIHVDALKAERDAKQDELLGFLQKEGLKSMKVDSGDGFSVAEKKGYRFSNPIAEIKFATENNCLTPDKRLVAQKLRKLDELPSSVEEVKIIYMSFRKAKK